METIDGLLTNYGLAALFLVLLVKAAGVPVPVPADLLMLMAAARAAEGKLPLWETVGLLLLALVLGGLVQYRLIAGPARGLLDRHGHWLGLTPARLARAAAAVRRGGVLGVTLAILMPGIRSVTVAGCGLVGLPLRTFLPGLTLGSAGFLLLHIGLGYGGMLLLRSVADALPLAGWLALTLAAAGLLGWLLLRWRPVGRGVTAGGVTAAGAAAGSAAQGKAAALMVGGGGTTGAPRGASEAAPAAAIPLEGDAATIGAAAGAWCEACCPVCLTLGLVGRLPGAATDGR